MNSSFQANNLMDNGSSLLQQMYLISIDSSQRHFNKQLIAFQLKPLQRQEDKPTKLNEIQRNPWISHTKIQNPQTNPHNSIEILFKQTSATPNKKRKHTDTSENSKNLNTIHKGLTSASLPHSGGISFVVDFLSQPRKSQ